MNSNNYSRKIWMITPNYYPAIGGSEKQAQGISEALLKMGWQVNVLTRSYCKENGEEYSKLNEVTVVRISSPKKNKLSSLFFVIIGLWYLLWHGRKDIYHAHDVGSAGWLAVLAGNLLGGKSIVKMRTGLVTYQHNYSSGLSKIQFRLLLKYVDLLIVVNKEMEQWLIERGIPIRKIQYLPNSVDVVKYSPHPKMGKVKIRNKLNLPLDKINVLYVGRLCYLKGVDILIKAWCLVPKKTRDNAALVIVGDGKEREYLIQSIEGEKISKSVHMVGMIENVSDYYLAADIFVLPSRTEGLSNSQIEAMACGLPCIVSAVGGSIDLIEDGINGLLFSPEDPAQLSRQLIYLINSKNKWDEMGQLARKTIVKEANWEKTMSTIIDTYKDLLL